MLLVFHINDWQDEQTIGDPGLRITLENRKYVSNPKPDAGLFEQAASGVK